MVMDLLKELEATLANRQQKVKNIANRQALYADPRLPERFKTPEALARLNATLAPE